MQKQCLFVNIRDLCSNWRGSQRVTNPLVASSYNAKEPVVSSLSAEHAWGVGGRGASGAKETKRILKVFCYTEEVHTHILYMPFRGHSLE